MRKLYQDISMLESLESTLKRGLRGKYIHIDPMKAVEGLTADTAYMIPRQGTHSCWHILHHIVYWQELMLKALRGETVDWPKNNEKSWQSDTISKKADDWMKLVQKFEQGLIEADAQTNRIESMEDLPAWPKVPPFAAIMSIVQHNTYHIGEIVATRQALGLWPPPTYKETF